MSDHTKLLIECENKNDGTYPLMVLVTDPHKKHLIGHLRAMYRPKVLSHMIQHLFMWRAQKNYGLPDIELEINDRSKYAVVFKAGEE